jgi:hypothetical protein
VRVAFTDAFHFRGVQGIGLRPALAAVLPSATRSTLACRRDDQLEKKRRKLACDWSNFCSQIGNAALIT